MIDSQAFVFMEAPGKHQVIAGSINAPVTRAIGFCKSGQTDSPCAPTNDFFLQTIEITTQYAHTEDMARLGSIGIQGKHYWQHQPLMAVH